MMVQTKGGFLSRHLGPGTQDEATMLAALKVDSLEVLVQQTVPESIHLPQPLTLPEPLDEPGALKELRSMAATNRRTTCFLGQGFHPC
ncbi:MAG: hypothetical protein OXG36_14155, partial [Caldilineaceae bacterium]|nr:hypothetical protein [Caldilineaceae bacterium]